MDASSRSLPHLSEYDSFFFDESSGRLVHSVGHSFRISTSPSFIDLYPDDLFTIFLSSPATSDFDFDLHPPVVDDAPPSPMLQTSASRIFHDGRLLPCEPGGGSCAEDHSADVPGAPCSSAFSPPSTPVPRSPCSTAASKHARPRPTTLCAGRRRAGSSPWKVLRFVMPLYRKVRAIARRHSSRFTSLAASPARGATSSVAYHGRAADTDVHDAILYCKKSSGSGV